MKLVDMLRHKCAKQGIGTSGTASVLFERLKTHEKKAAKRAGAANKTVNTTSADVVKPNKTVPFKGNRLSASYYFHTVCGGKIGRCSPQIIPEKDGRRKLKEIRVVNGKTGKHPIWVLVKG